MPRPKTLQLREPHRAPKRQCKRGHLLRKVGWVLNSVVIHGTRYPVRRCKACLRQDVESLKGRKTAKEKTGARVAKIAGKILAMDAWDIGSIKWVDIRALAASCLTQREPTPRKNGRVSLGKWITRRNAAAKEMKRKRRAK